MDLVSKKPLASAEITDLSAAQFTPQPSTERIFLKTISVVLAGASLVTGLIGCKPLEERLQERTRVDGKEVLADSSQFVGKEVTLVSSSFNLVETQTGIVKVGVPGYTFGPYYSIAKGGMKIGMHYSMNASYREELRTNGWMYATDQGLKVFLPSYSSSSEIKREQFGIVGSESQQWLLSGLVMTMQGTQTPYLHLQYFAKPTK